MNKKLHIYIIHPPPRKVNRENKKNFSAEVYFGFQAGIICKNKTPSNKKSFARCSESIYRISFGLLKK